MIRIAGLPNPNDVAEAEGAGRVANEPVLREALAESSVKRFLRAVKYTRLEVFCRILNIHHLSRFLTSVLEAPKPRPSTVGGVVDTNARKRAFEIGYADNAFACSCFCGQSNSCTVRTPRVFSETPATYMFFPVFSYWTADYVPSGPSLMA